MERGGKRKNLVTCAKCGAVYDLAYGRAFACGGCSSNVSCSYSKCPKCGHEFPLQTSSRSF